MRKVLQRSSSRAQSRVARVDWADGVSVWSPCKPFLERPQWAFHGSGVCRGHAGFGWQGPPSGPGSCQDEENTLSGHTVTGADVVVHVRHSFHFLRYAIDSPAGWHWWHSLLICCRELDLWSASPEDENKLQMETITFSLAVWGKTSPQRHFWIWGLFCFHKERIPRGEYKSWATRKRAKVSKLQNGVGWDQWLVIDGKKRWTPRLYGEALAYHFVLDIWNLRATSIWALRWTVRFLRVLSKAFDILFQEPGTGGCAGVDTSLHLASEIKGHFEKVKINVSYQFQPLKKKVTYFSLTHFN